MTGALQEWEDHYRPLLGRRLETFCFMPMAGADTPDVVAGLENSPIWFSGAVEMAFEATDPVFLTWVPAEEGYQLLPSRSLAERWLPYSLDRVRKSSEGVWNGLEGSILIRVELHSMQDVPDQSVVVAEHLLATAQGDRTLWIATAHAPAMTMEDGDDLCVGIDGQPPSRAPLILLGTIQ